MVRANRKMCTISVIGIIIILLAGYFVGLRESIFFTFTLYMFVSLMIYYEESDRLEYDRRSQRKIERVKLLKPRGTILLMFIAIIPLLTIANLIDGSTTLADILHPYYFIAVSILLILVLIPNIIARYRYNMKIESGEILVDSESKRSPTQGLGSLFGPSSEEFDEEFDQ